MHGFSSVLFGVGAVLGTEAIVGHGSAVVELDHSVAVVHFLHLLFMRFFVCAFQLVPLRVGEGGLCRAKKGC